MKTFWNLLIVVLLVGIFSCSDEDNSSSPPAGDPVFSVKLVDAPSAYDAVNVEIVGMEANIGSGWINLPLDNMGVYNLLSFTNGNSLALLNYKVMSPCTISELRLNLGTNNTVVVNGETFELETPSGQTSGYKVKMHPQTLVAGGVYFLVLDFNTEKSVHETGNGKYMLQPVITGYFESTVGTLTGIIVPITGAYYVEATNATDTSGAYINAATGQFLLSKVLEGSYNVKFFPNPGHAEKIVPNVMVVAGQTTDMGTITIK
jgi:hypothetical protein